MQYQGARATRASTSPIARDCDRTFMMVEGLPTMQDLSKVKKKVQGKGGEPNFMSGSQQRTSTRTPWRKGGRPLKGEEWGWHHSPRQKPSRGRRRGGG